MRTLLVIGLFSATTLAIAQQESIHLFGSQSLMWIGSQDIRRGVGIAYQTAKPDPRLSFRRNEAQLVFEGYAMHTWGGRRGRDRDQASMLGALALARYEYANGWFYELGWGLQYANPTTHDLDSRLNSTPTLGLGYVFDCAGTDVRTTLRFMHSSNGGTNPPNQGQNQLWLMIGFRI